MTSKKTARKSRARQIAASKAFRRSVLGLAGLSVIYGAATSAEPLITQTRGTYGTPGVIDMPTAEVFNDGYVGMSSMFWGAGSRHNISFQISPRLTGVFRYTSIDDGYLDGTDDQYYDRSFDLHYQILGESDTWPALAIGLRDFVGTGIYSGEYIVATKALRPNLTVTGGLGWGRLGGKGGIGSPFGARPEFNIGNGGETNSMQWFKGEAAPFFGVEWSPRQNLMLKAEYSTDDIGYEQDAGNVTRKSSLNFGADYRISETMSASVYSLYGDSVGFQFNMVLDPKGTAYPSGLERAPLPVRPRPNPNVDMAAWSQAWTAEPDAPPALRESVATALSKEGIYLERMGLTGERVEIRIRNDRFGAMPQAIGRSARILSRALPASVDTFVITPTSDGLPLSSVTFKRGDIERYENSASSEIKSAALITDSREAEMLEGVTIDDQFPRFQWSVGPGLKLHIFDPESPLLGDLTARLNMRYDIAPGWNISTQVSQKIIGNLDKSKAPSDETSLHRVRSDNYLYERNGDLTVDRLTLANYSHPLPNIYTRVSAGLLETMYGGVSAEALWKPVGSRLAFGAEVNWVKQRDYDQRFSFRDFDTVTGHISTYYEHNSGYSARLDVGRYLAGDVGATLELAREFAHGWRFGVFATKTNLSSDEFGDGSFDKGITLTIPMETLLGSPTTKTVHSELRPFSSDGGAKVNVQGRLYEKVREGQEPALNDEWGRFWR